MLCRLYAALVLILVAGSVAFGRAAPVTAQDATPTAGTPARTDVRYVLPFTPEGLNPGLTVTATEEGICGFSSIVALDRPDAWDCLGANNEIYDPCFENPFLARDGLGEVACLDSPFTTDVIVLTLTQPLVREKDAPAIEPTGGPGSGQGAAGAALAPWDLPWALELANGDRCTLLHGTLTRMAGQVAHYGCADGGIVLGETDRSQPVWTVTYLAASEVASTLVEVTAAWS
ncbi:MAG: hypothetical protein AVDCRST_MAG59-990 [uncultured Thermomicrobiales bacterium]|uniref:Uncharacterized protein n=1 Tax=uncultured Thermomicrobiales bacterium TaxID=1645740 RepID=A0A6J4U7Y6_9BACT|nr:MAG: hypothetical protein AVDCRST_MAG59-990 [uncultured Thermomicrobiales bacterium]